MPRKKGTREGRKEGRRNKGSKKGSKKGRKEDKKEGTENPTPTPSTLIQVIRIILLLIIIIIVRLQYSNCVKRWQMPKAFRKVASSIFAPAETQPRGTLSELVIKVFANGGGGAAPPLPPTPFFFNAMQAGFQKPRTRDKDVCKWGGPPQPPSLFLRHAGCLSRKSHHQQELRQTCSCYGVFLSHKIAAAIILAAKTKPISTPSEPVIKVFAKWGGFAPLPPPTPGFFYTMQANFK